MITGRHSWTVLVGCHMRRFNGAIMPTLWTRPALVLLGLLGPSHVACRQDGVAGSLFVLRRQPGSRKSSSRRPALD